VQVVWGRKRRRENEKGRRRPGLERECVRARQFAREVEVYMKETLRVCWRACICLFVCCTCKDVLVFCRDAVANRKVSLSI